MLSIIYKRGNTMEIKREDFETEEEYQKAMRDKSVADLLTSYYKQRIETVMKDDDSEDSFERRFDKKENSENAAKIAFAILGCFLVFVLLVAACFQM